MKKIDNLPSTLQGDIRSKQWYMPHAMPKHSLTCRKHTHLDLFITIRCIYDPSIHRRTKTLFSHLFPFPHHIPRIPRIPHSSRSPFPFDISIYTSHSRPDSHCN